MHNLVLTIYPSLLVGLSRVAALPRPFGRYWMLAFLWDHLGPVVTF